MRTQLASFAMCHLVHLEFTEAMYKQGDLFNINGRMT